MIKFNDNNIIVGHIKQILNSFNLPKCRIYKNDSELYENSYYIKDGWIQFYKVKDGVATWNKINYYNYNVIYKNITKNLKITNNIYDSYTHEYLGDYLRFLRDYKQIDLMPLYNCFSNRLAENLELSFSTKIEEIINEKEIKKTYTYNFSDKDAMYKIYMIPVKNYNKYTIALDCDAPVEMCCSFYGKYQFSEQSNDTTSTISTIALNTYQKEAKCAFGAPIVYTKLMNITDETSLKYAKKYEHDLKLFIKVPAKNSSSLVILEGDYSAWNAVMFKTAKGYLNQETNMFVTNFEGPYENQPSSSSIEKYNDHIGYQEGQKFVPITQLQLLSMNTKESYPFADSLLEYITNNAITSETENADDIKRIASVMNLNIPSAHIQGEIPITKINTYGIWESKINPILYNYINEHHNTFLINRDNLGFVTKEVEKYYLHKDSDGEITTLSNVDIYEEEK